MAAAHAEGGIVVAVSFAALCALMLKNKLAMEAGKKEVFGKVSMGQSIVSTKDMGSASKQLLVSLRDAGNVAPYLRLRDLIVRLLVGHAQRLRLGRGGGAAGESWRNLRRISSSSSSPSTLASGRRTAHSACEVQATCHVTFGCGASTSVISLGMRKGFVLVEGAVPQVTAGEISDGFVSSVIEKRAQATCAEHQTAEQRRGLRPPVPSTSHNFPKAR